MADLVYIDASLAPRTIAALEPAVRKLAEDEMDDDITRIELFNLANELRATMQRVAAQGRRA